MVLCFLTLIFGCDRPEHDGGEPADGFAERSAARRLTVEEWQNTVVDLLGVTVDRSLLPADELTAGFPANVSASLSDLEVEATLAAAESAAAAATVDPEQFLGCDPAERACVEGWAGPFLERAWRRPIDADEVASFLALTELGETPADGVRLAVTGALVSGSFLYRPEVGGTPAGGRVELDGWQIASRLSYLLWRTMPDEILLEAARTGALSTPEQVEDQALRLLADPRGAEAIASFHVDWLGLGSLPLLDRVPTPPPPQPLESHPLLDLDADLWEQTDAQGLTLPAGTFADVVLDTGAPAISSGTSDADIYAHHGVDLGSTFMVRGNFSADDPDASLGVTFLSGLPASNAWYRLERRPGELYALESSGTDGACVAESTLVSLDVTASVDFEIQVEATFSAVTIEARVWAAGAPRPIPPQLVCLDDSFTRLTHGTVGVWSSGPGIKAWGELLLQTSVPEEPFDFPPVAAAFVDGARSFLETWASDGARLDELLLADWAMANQTLAPYLGVEGVMGDSWQRVTLPPERLGVLTQPLFLSVLAKPDQSSPILRGKTVREKLLCDVLLPPPPGVAAIAPDLDPSLTTRERFAEHVADPSCSACHLMIDPIGFGFEAFDQLGVYREFENGLPIDASGEVVAGGDADGPFVDVRGLVEQLAASDEVRRCVVTHWYRYAAAHLEDPEAEDPALVAALAACTDETCRVEDIVRAIVTSDSFRFRAAHDGDTP